VLVFRLRSELNATLDASKKKDAPTKKISLNDFVIKVTSTSNQFHISSQWLVVDLCRVFANMYFLSTYR
jgi:hypothetical protein